MPRGLRLPVVLVTAVAVAEAAVALLRPRDRRPARVEVKPRDYFSAGELGKARRFRRGQLWLAAASAAVELALLVLAVRRPPRAGRRPLPAGAVTAAGLTVATTVATLPLSAVARERARRVGLVTQSWAGWAGDVAKGLAIGATLSGAGGAALVLGRRRFGRAWWAPGAAVAVGFAVVFTTAGPVVLDPTFNRFTVLPDGPTRSDVLTLAGSAGVDVGEVYEVDASRRTTAANAYVTGLFATKRVVLFDTLLKDFNPAEVRLVVAHELAHVRHRDVAHGLLWMALVATPLGMVSNQLSRAIERRADAYALELTGEPETLIAFERRITLKNVGDPAPPRWLQFLLASHPDTMERIGQALAAPTGPRGDGTRAAP